jgi:hypothetical protein
MYLARGGESAVRVQESDSEHNNDDENGDRHQNARYAAASGLHEPMLGL